MKEQRYQCIYLWHRYNGCRATWRALVEACFHISDVDLATRISDAYVSCIFINHLKLCLLFLQKKVEE